jgi:hypothetical protein
MGDPHPTSVWEVVQRLDGCGPGLTGLRYSPSRVERPMEKRFTLKREPAA